MGVGGSEGVAGAEALSLDVEVGAAGLPEPREDTLWVELDLGLR